MIVNLFLNIKPTPLKRARTTVRGNFATTYYDAKAKAEMDELRISILNALNKLDKETYDFIRERTLKEVPIGLNIQFGFDFPKSYSKKKQNELINTPHTLLPDLDNLIKNVLDRGDGLLWKNDKTICYLDASKSWQGQDYISIEIKYYE